METKRIKIVREAEEYYKLEPVVSIVLGQSGVDEPSRFMKVVVEAFTLLPTNKARYTQASIVQELRGYTSSVKVLDVEEDEKSIIDNFLAEVLERTYTYSDEGYDGPDEDEVEEVIEMGASTTLDIGEVRLHFTVHEKVDTPIVFFDSVS